MNNGKEKMKEKKKERERETLICDTRKVCYLRSSTAESLRLDYMASNVAASTVASVSAATAAWAGVAAASP